MPGLQTYNVNMIKLNERLYGQAGYLITYPGSPPSCEKALKAHSILSELTGKTIPVVIRTSLFMKTIQPDQ